MHGSFQTERSGHGPWSSGFGFPPPQSELLALLGVLGHGDALTLLLCSFTESVSELGIRC